MRRPGWLPVREEALPAFASAALFLIAFPPFRLLLPAFLTLIPVAIVVARKVDVGEPVRASFRFGFWYGAMAYGLVAMIPILGDILLYGLGMPLVVLGGVAIGVLLVGLVGYPLMYPTVSAEGRSPSAAIL